MQLHRSSGNWRLGLILTLIAVCIWGTLPIALSIVLNALDVYTITWFRFLTAFIFLLLYLAVIRKLPKWQKINPASIKLFLVAIIFLICNYLFFLQGLQRTSPTNAKVFIQLAPISLSLGALIVFRERYTPKQWLGLSILILGLTLFFHEQLQTVLDAPNTYLLGNLILILAAIVWGIYALAQKQLLQTYSSAEVMLCIYGGCTLLLTPLAQPQNLITLSPLNFLVLLYCGFNTLIGYGCFGEALVHLEASRVSAILTLTPLVTMICVQIFSGLFPQLLKAENLTILAVIGAIVVVIGAACVSLGKNKTSRKN